MRAGAIAVPSEAAKPCTGAPLPRDTSKPQLQAFALLQTGKLEICDERRALGVQAMELHNAEVVKAAERLERRPWWKFWRE